MDDNNGAFLNQCEQNNVNLVRIQKVIFNEFVTNPFELNLITEALS